MKTQKLIVNSRKSLDDLIDIIAAMFLQFKFLTVTISCKRSLDQNALYAHWIKIIAAEIGDSEESTRNDLKYKFGMPIKLRSDLELSDFLKRQNWGQFSERWSTDIYGAKVLFVSKIAVTSEFSHDEMSEFLEQIKAHFLQQGIILPSKKEVYNGV